MADNKNNNERNVPHYSIYILNSNSFTLFI